MTVPELCRRQAEWCRKLGSPLYHSLLAQVAEDYENHGPARALLDPHRADPPGSALALRLMGAVHSLVMGGEVPQLAAFYPSAGGKRDASGSWSAFRAVLAEKQERLRLLLLRPVQTNDVGRSASLLGGFLLVARQYGLPLRILEIGASAGLNLLWDHYRYEWPDGSWGSASSPVALKNIFVNSPPRLPEKVTVLERMGCDPNPLDPCTIEGQNMLISFTWADQIERIERLRRACLVAGVLRVRVVEAGAAEWLREQLRHRAPGVATIVFHSVVWQYLTQSEQADVLDLLKEAGGRATRDAPLAYLRMEPGAEDGAGPPEVRLQLFPDGVDTLLALTSYHAPTVRWLQDA